nr:LamG domain-containing protein [Pseudomonas aegrilactucae]
MVSRQGHALALSDQHHGSVNEAAAFSLVNEFTLEAWVAPAVLNRKQVIVEKKGAYSLYINSLGDVCLTVHLDSPSRSTSFAHEVRFRLASGTTSHVVAQVHCGGVKQQADAQEPVESRYFVHAELFVNGESVQINRQDDLLDAVVVKAGESTLYVGCSDRDTFHFEGLLSHVRVWSRVLHAAEILRTAQFRLTPTDHEGLVAGWDFDEMAGEIAADLTGTHPLQLTGNQLWAIWPDVAQAELLIDGQPVPPKRLTVAQVGGYQDRQFTMGGVLRGSTLECSYSGRLDEVRMFSARLTWQQIRETINSPLHGRENWLAAHWDMQAGSGPTLFDASGHGNNGAMSPATAAAPAWANPGAPIQNEAQYVFNVLGTALGLDFVLIDGAPTVVEYGNTQEDAYANRFSVMKRAYAYPTAYDGTALRAGYKVSDLETIYVGQVQSKPTLIGVIEGGPPIPSENQTLAFWENDRGGPARLYDGFCSVAYTESDSKVWSFKGSQSKMFKIDTSTKAGGLIKGEVGISVGFGAEATTVLLKAEGKIGVKYADSRTEATTQEVQSTHSSNLYLSTSMRPTGHWEPENAILNPVVGRRFVPNNAGMALVKSSVADLYMLALKGTQTPVAYQLQPNTDIPVDTNILIFPINPNYIKNGTLDGKVGLVNDLNYPEANETRGSYFKPVEAYRTKQLIEKREASLKAYYEQFDLTQYDDKEQLGLLKSKIAENPAYDFAGTSNLRSLCNTYVWTADGGLHSQEHSVANSYSETYVAGKTFTLAGGPDVRAEAGSPGGGLFTEHDTMIGETWTMTATRSATSSTGFSLECDVSPTGFLAAPIMSTAADGRLQLDGYQSSAAPGKVDGYRYMSFLLSPNAENFTALAGVIEPNWLNNSTTAAAAAMREALSTPSKPWRVLYRTTYVSRVPAPFQPVKDDSQVPRISPPPNLAANRWLVLLIEHQLGIANPTQLQIATAIDAVLGPPGAEPGLLRELIPWWATYYAAASVYGNPEFLELAQLRLDLLEYMASKFEADNYPA